MCSEPCYGAAPGYMDNWFSATCADVQAWPHNKRQWHFQGDRVKSPSTYTLQDYPGRVCPGNDGTYRDAWHWDVANCQGCNPRKFRCHDGQTRLNGGAWEFTISEGHAACNGVWGTC